MSSGPGSSPLNQHQRHHIWATCQYVDRLLSDLEAVLAAAASGSPFAKYADDLTPAQRRVFRDYCAGIRAHMISAMQRHGIEPGSAPSSSRHALRTGLGLIDVAIEEMRPQYMRGYGAMTEEALPELNGLATELQAIVRRLDAALGQGAAADLQSRVAALPASAPGTRQLGLLERMVERHGLVEFRQALEGVLERAENPRFEVAVFGRVSSGKSSLINYIAGVPILPTGVTPVTAVPARLERGEADVVEVRFADRPAERVPLTRLPELVTEAGNPGNRKHVARLRIVLAASRLPEGMTLVDTPGFGSLASDGAAEMLAYLPRCDFGIVLLDASAPLTPDDAGTLARLEAAGIPSMVVLSKTDLLSDADLEAVRRDVTERLAREMGAAVAVHAVSTVSAKAALADQWLAEAFAPVARDHRARVASSIERKVEALRAGIAGALSSRLSRRATTASRAGGSAGPGTAAEAAAGARGTNGAVDPAPIEAEFRRTASAFEDVRKVCEAQRDPPQLVLTEALDLAAERAGTALDYPHSMPGGVDAAVRAAIAQVAADNADDVRRPLGVLLERVKSTLANASRAAGVPESAAIEEWGRLLREMPPFALADVHVDARVSLRKMLGKSVAHARTRAAIAAQIGEQVEQALRAHSLALHEWSLRVLGQVRDAFTAQADVIRAQLSGGSTGDASTLAADRAALEPAVFYTGA